MKSCLRKLFFCILALIVMASVALASADTAESGTLLFEVHGASRAVSYSLKQNGKEVLSGTASPDAASEVKLPAGEYEMAVSLPDGIGALSVNGTDLYAKGRSVWKITVNSGVANSLNLETVALGRLRGMVEVADGTNAALVGPKTSMKLTVSKGVLSADDLFPGKYTVTLPLDTEGYSGTGWTISGTAATISAKVSEGKLTNLGTLKKPEAALEEEPEDVQPAAETLKELESRLLSPNRELMDVTPRTIPEDLSIAGTGNASLTVFVFADANHNKWYGINEKPMSDVSVELILTARGKETIVGKKKVDAKGNAVFKGLPAGTYHARVTLPDGYSFSEQGSAVLKDNANYMEGQSARIAESPQVKLTEEASLTMFVGARKAGRISGQVWYDSNGDGIQQKNEPGMAGVLVEAVGQKNGLTYQMVTGEDGYYDMHQLRPGFYKLRVTLPEGMMFTKYSKKGGNARSIITTAGVNVATKDFDLNNEITRTEQNIGVIGGASIRVIAFYDENYNGQYDEGEKPLPGVNIILQKQGNGDEVARKTTGKTGAAVFDSLRTIQYRLRPTIPDGTLYTKAGTGKLGNRFTTQNGKRTDLLDNINVENEKETVLYLGVIKTGSISGTIYMDNNFSGTMDRSEERGAWMNITLVDEQGLVVDTARTDKSGVFTFRDVMPGNYRLTLTATEGYAFTREGSGNVMLNRGGGKGSTELFWLGLDENKTNMNCGMIVPGKISGVFYADSNDNGKKDDDEGGMTASGAAIVLVSASGEETREKVPANGSFSFDSVMPGEYTVRYELPNQAVFGEVPRSVTQNDKSAVTEKIQVVSGGSVTLSRVGALTLGRINGTIFCDENANGAQNRGESGLAGAVLVLTPKRSDLKAVTVTTGANGSFSFTNIRPDTYQLTLTLADGRVVSRRSSAEISFTPGQAEETLQVKMPMGTRLDRQMIGAVLPGAIRGVAWLDENNNGRRDEGEAALTGAKVTVYDLTTGSFYAELTVSKSGVFSSNGMIPGNYALHYALDSNSRSAKAGDTTFTVGDGELVMDAVKVTQGTTVKAIRLGVVRYTSISGDVWVDRNGKTEPVSGATVVLLNKKGTKVATVKSGEDGTWKMNRLMPGTYQLSVTLPEGQIVVRPDDVRLTKGKLKSIMTVTNARQGTTDYFDLRMAQDMTQCSIGSVLPGMLGDFVWVDENANGLQDSEDGGIPNVTVHLYSDGREVGKTVTDQYGFYRFTDLYPGNYTLRVDTKGVKPTKQRTDLPGIVSVMQANGESIPVLAVSGGHNYDADLGFVLEQKGVYPAGYGQGDTQDWSK